jgi:hypothetical protein
MTATRAGSGLLLAALLSGCGLMTAPGEGDRLSDARQRWTTQGQRDYVYEIRSDCYCGLAGRWIEVTIFGGQVASGKYVDTGAQIEAAYLPALPTVDDLFSRVQSAIDGHAVMLEVSYDAQDGHPTRINVDMRHNLADEEYLLQSRNLMGMLTSAPNAP